MPNKLYRNRKRQRCPMNLLQARTNGAQQQACACGVICISAGIRACGPQPRACGTGCLPGVDRISTPGAQVGRRHALAAARHLRVPAAVSLGIFGAFYFCIVYWP